MNFFLSLWYNYKSWRFERKCIKYFGAKPETIYLSKSDFESLQKRLKEPKDPASLENLKKLLSRESPWKKNNKK